MEFSHRSNMGNDESSSSFSIGKSAQERGLSHVPESYVIPTSHDPNLHPETAKVPVVDLSRLRHGSAQRSLVIQDFKNACHRMGFFQATSHLRKHNGDILLQNTENRLTKIGQSKGNPNPLFLLKGVLGSGAAFNRVGMHTLLIEPQLEPSSYVIPINIGSVWFPKKGFKMSSLYENDDSAFVGDLDCNFAVDKEEKVLDHVDDKLARSDDLNVDLNQHGKLGSPSLPTDFTCDISESHGNLPAEFGHDDVRSTKFDSDHERTESPLKNNHYQGVSSESTGKSG
nr:hypothetical protein CFP56_08524 [Quercus suber]